jgi:hypothetical protein
LFVLNRHPEGDAHMQTITTCCQWIATDHGTRQCSRTATHLTPSGDKGVCTQHARSYDVEIRGAA